MTRTDLEAAGMLLGDTVENRGAGRQTTVVLTCAHGDVAVGQAAVREDAPRRVTITANGGRACDLLKRGRGEVVAIGRCPRGHAGATRSSAGGPTRPPALT